MSIDNQTLTHLSDFIGSLNSITRSYKKIAVDIIYSQIPVTDINGSPIGSVVFVAGADQWKFSPHE